MLNIKVINVVQDFNVGGIQSVLLSLLRAFKDDKRIDFSVVVLEENKGSAFDKAAESEGLNITYLGAGASKNSHYYIRKIHDYLVYNGRLFFYLLKNKPDVIHTHNTRILKHIISTIKHTYKKYAWVHTLHSDPFAVHKAHIPVIKQAVEEYGVLPVCLNSTQFNKAKERYGLKECRYINNIVDLKRFHGTKELRDVCRKGLNIPQNAYVIGTVGRLEAVKNYAFLLDIFSNVLNINKNALLIFAGDGGEAENLKAKAKALGVLDKVRFLGYRTDTENIYPCFDVFALTSVSEASSVVFLEAQAAGLPCVISAAVTKESVISKSAVIMEENAAEEAWATTLLTPSDFCKQYSNEEDFSENAVKQSLIDLYGLAAKKGK